MDWIAVVTFVLIWVVGAWLNDYTRRHGHP